MIDADDEIYLASENEETMDLMVSSTDDSAAGSLGESDQQSKNLTRKTFSIEEGVSGEFDVISGKATVIIEDIADPTLGITISHIYNPNKDINKYGKNFKLNLDEKLVRINESGSSVQYCYTDAKGDEHTFKEYFYRIGINGKKTYITENISSIIADVDGRLWLNNIEVFRELISDEGLIATSRLDGTVNNVEWIDQRVDEEKQAEEQVKSYEDLLCDFIKVNMDSSESSGMIGDILSDPNSIESFLSDIDNDNCLLLSNEEKVSCESLLVHKESLNVSIESLELQRESIINSAVGLLIQYNSFDTSHYQLVSDKVKIKNLNLQIGDYVPPPEKEQEYFDSGYDDYKNLIGTKDDKIHNETYFGLANYHKDTILPAQTNELNVHKHTIKNQVGGFTNIPNDYFNDLHSDYNYADLMELPTRNGESSNFEGTLTKQYKNINDQIENVGLQITNASNQISLLKSKSAINVKRFKTYYKEYLNLKNQLDTLKTQLPVSYLISDNVVKCFNDAGDLVIIQNKYGKNVVIEREKYLASGATRVSAVYDKDGNTMKFFYNGAYKLSEICNSVGERVSFTYNSDYSLISVVRDNHPTIKLSYETISGTKFISKIKSSNKISTEFSYASTGMLSSIIRSTDVNSISHDNIEICDDTILSTVAITYISGKRRVAYDNAKHEIYEIDDTGEHITTYYELLNGIVTDAEHYMYCDKDMICRTEVADRSCLNKYSYEQFASKFIIGTTENITYDSFNEPIVVINTRYDPTKVDYDGPVEQSTVEYTYNDDRKLVEKKTTHAYYDDYAYFDVTVRVEKYYYDNAGSIIRTEAYMKGEELKTGVNIDEHIYDENGVEIKSISYNSLDPSSKFYTEKQVDEKGRVIAEYTESGEHKTIFDYERDRVTVNTERLPNGSKFSYGRTNDGGVTAITHSTDNGEENSTIQTRTLGVVTEVKSGNNTVRYAYDEKRRVKSVSLNGVDDYVTYAYEGDNTDAEKVTAITKSGVVSTTVKNAHGNITESTLGTAWSVNNTYDDNQQLTNTVDSVSGETTFRYDGNGNMTSMSTDGYYEGYGYDEFDNTVKNKYIIADTLSQTYAYTYKDTASKALESISIGGNRVRPNTDALGRNTGKVIEVGDNKISEEKISYVKFGDHATNLPSNVRFATNGVFNESIQYKYDSMGNIVEVFENGRSACRYEYDALGRLTREDNVAFGKTTTWSYDNNGNIIAKYEYAITAKPTSELHLLDCNYIPYTYDDNSDQLMSYNGESFEYDVIGNPTMYRGRSAMWIVGRRLMSYNGSVFGYDARGRRINKNGIPFTYDSNGNLIKQGNELSFMYDHTGVFAVSYNGATYYYRKDIQGNIIALLDNTGTVVVKYKYDAWGKCKVLDSTGAEITDDTHIGILNPFRYRSYYFDHGIGLYFLKTRYYDPEVGRFITIDDISYLDPESINGLNLYAYCLNNPVMCVDPSGTFVITGTVLLMAALIGAAAGAIVGGIYGGVTAVANNQNVLSGVLIGILSGSVMGAGAGIAATFIAPILAGEGVVFAALSGASAGIGNALTVGAALTIGTTTAFGSGAIGGVISDTLTQTVNNGKVSDWSSVCISALQWGTLNTIGTYLSALGGTNLTNFENFVMSQVFNYLTGSLGLLFDVIRSGLGYQKSNVASIYT